jgi:hypothetical protein
MTRAPLRFLLLVTLLWAGVRAAILLPGGSVDMAPIPAAAATSPAVAAVSPAPSSSALPAGRPNRIAVAARGVPLLIQGRPAVVPLVRPATGAKAAEPTPYPEQFSQPPAPIMPRHPAGLAAPFAPPLRANSSGWGLSAWLLVRDEGGAALAPGGTLGGSQAGARVTYALGHGLGLSGRLYLPLRHTAGTELAAGVDWRPRHAIPVNLLAERRQRLGRDGRSAFALTLYGGTSRNLSQHLRLDAWGQAGVVGLRRRDLFADGALRLARRVGPVELGAGAWGAAQPGAERVDAGPSLSWRMPVRGAGLRLQADWRFRMAGEAAPRSGPSLTLAADF